MVRLGGFEPPTFGATIQRSNQLSYNRVSLRPVLAGTRWRNSAGAIIFQGRTTFLRPARAICRV